MHCKGGRTGYEWFHGQEEGGRYEEDGAWTSQPELLKK